MEQTFLVVYQWCLEGTFMLNMTHSFTRWGLVGLIAIDVMAFFSTSFWRRKAYNVFLASHIIGFTILLPAVRNPQMLQVPLVTSNLHFSSRSCCTSQP